MLLFCPNCGRRFEIPGHLEANAAQKCPSCGTEFGGAKPAEEKPEPGGKLRFVSGGETDVGRIVPPQKRDAPAMKTTPLPGIAKPARRVDPDACEIVGEMGHDGAGILYAGHDPDSGDSVLVRRLLPEGAAVADAQRWATEATKLQGVTHPRLVTVLGVGLRDGSPHVVTERVDGQNLAEVSGGRPLNLRQVTEFAFQVVDALTAAHGSGVLHGDLKPSNVIIDSQGRARVADFGFAPRAFDAGEPVDTPHVRGWLPFAPPEVVRNGPEAIIERSDSYGLGALLYFMLTGRPPFAAADAKTLLAEVLEGTPPSPGSVNPKVPPALDALVMRALEKEPAHRPSNAQAVALELRKIEREGRGIQAPARRAPRRGRKVLAALVVIGGLGCGGYYLYHHLSVKGAARRARGYAEEARKLKDHPERLDQAVDFYRNAVKEAHGTSELAKFQIEFAELLLGAGRAGEAAELLDAAAGAEAPAAKEARALLPSALARAGRAEATMIALRKLVPAGDGVEAVLRAGLKAGDGLLGLGKTSEARDVLVYVVEEAERAGSPALAARAALGDVYAALDEGTEARRTFVEVLKAEGGDEVTRARAALGLVRQIEPLGPDFELTTAEEGALSASPLAQALYARILAVRGMLDRAGRIVKRALAAKSLEDTERAWVLLAHGEVLEGSGSLDEARARFVEVGSVSGENANLVDVASLARVGLARLTLRAGRAASALAAFRNCVDAYAAKPKAVAAVAWALIGQGDALRLMGKPDQATGQYREVTSIAYRGQREQYLVALCNLGEVAMETRDRARMRTVFGELADEDATGSYGDIARAMTGDITEGELLEAATAAKCDLAARAHYCVGLKRELAGDSEGARAAFERAVDAASGFSWYGTAAEERLR
jgi:tetratricopeptide (TPR) repeat protein